MMKEFTFKATDEQISYINNKIKNYPWSSIQDMDG